MTFHWKVVEQNFAAVFVSQFYSVCNFGKFINFGLGIVRSERVNIQWNCAPMEILISILN